MGGKISIRRVYRTRPAVTTAILHRHGAEAARRAHNPEDLGSKPSAGIFLYGRPPPTVEVVKKLK